MIPTFGGPGFVFLRIKLDRVFTQKFCVSLKLFWSRPYLKITKFVRTLLPVTGTVQTENAGFKAMLKAASTTSQFATTQSVILLSHHKRTYHTRQY